MAYKLLALPARSFWSGVSHGGPLGWLSFLKGGGMGRSARCINLPSDAVPQGGAKRTNWYAPLLMRSITVGVLAVTNLT